MGINKFNIRKSSILIFFVLVMMVNLSLTSIQSESLISYHDKLSDYGFFEGVIKEQKPAPHLLPYELNSPLFSDYAHKLRFIKVPTGSHVSYNADSVLQFPVGTAIIKTFFYYADERNPSKGRRLIETRVLLHEPKGWTSLPYVWNDDQTDATLEVTGGNTSVSFRGMNGKVIQFDYSVPNMNQCKSCHERNGIMTPIGPSARQLNGDHDYDGLKENQLVRWEKEGVLTGLPNDKERIPHLVNYADHTQSIQDRAHAYLDINCAHCHNKSGQAQTSGLFLDWKTTDSTAYGFYKTPIAAGRGSGDLKVDILPGVPSQSILWYRMASTDPGVMMPELGRKLIHAEGVALISEWIKSMK